MKMSISLKSNDTNKDYLNYIAAKDAIEKIGGKNIVSFDNKIYFEYNDIIDLVVKLNNKNLKIEHWELIK